MRHRDLTTAAGVALPLLLSRAPARELRAGRWELVDRPATLLERLRRVLRRIFP